MAKKQLRSASAAEQFLNTVSNEGNEEIKEMEITNNPSVEKNENKVNDEKNKIQSPKMGQPKKYEEPTKHISFSLPVSVVENLKIMAGLRKTNQTQIILNLINQELEKDADRIKAYRELLGE